MIFKHWDTVDWHVIFIPCAQVARHIHSLRAHFKDLVDLLLGWSLEPSLPDSTRCFRDLSIVHLTLYLHLDDQVFDASA